ncbi:MAG TPA: basic amino acid/polyamine antiporter [Candidatus Dormibacteraeota bacterium]|nr:basic amino acid/polyamine antiporter [Candidatus Dormibacteraeota bacterium]
MGSESNQSEKLSLPALIAMVVGSMVGAGVFSLPRNFALATGPFGALIAWAIAGGGMLMLAFVFQTLAQRKPDIDAGIYAYARAGFGDYLGFLAAFGFWAGTCVGNVTYWVLIKSTLGAAIPVFGEGNTVPAVLVSSVGLWGFYFLILRGVKEAAFINQVVTFAKMVPLVLFVVIVAFAFKADVFAANFWGGEGADYTPLFQQVSRTMLVTVFVFLGIEGASVYSRFAKKREDVGRATVLGFLGVLALFMAVTLLSYGVMGRPELTGLRQPSVAGVLEAVVGHWGAVFISVGLIISVLGAYMAWTLLAAEVLFSAANEGIMPAFLAHENENKVPSTAVLLTTALVQVFLITTIFSDDAFTFTLKLCSALSLIPYLLVAAYAFKLVRTRETYDVNPRDYNKDLVIATLATIYTAFALYAGGLKFVLMSCLIYGPGTFLFFRARTEKGHATFTATERALFLVVAAAAVIGIIGLITGLITI